MNNANSQVDGSLNVVRAATRSIRLSAAAIYGDDCIERLVALVGLPCPDCEAILILDGCRLVCPTGREYFAKCFNSWNDPDAAEADILGNSPQ